MRINFLPPPFQVLIGISLLLAIIPIARAQENIALTRPASLTLFRPFTSTDDEGNFISLPLALTLGATVGYDDNVFTAKSDKVSSGFSGLDLGIGTHVGNQRTRLDAEISLGILYYWDRPGRAYDPDISLNLNFTHQINPRMVLGISSFMAYQSQPDFAIGNGNVDNVGDYFFSAESITLGYQWTRRFSTVTSYSISTYTYDESVVADQQNRVENLIAEQFRYSLYPTVTLVAEYRFGFVEYETADRNSYSHYLLGGADFSLSPKLTFSFRAGVELRHEEGEFASDSNYPYFESTLSYEYRPGSFVRWYNRYASEESDFGFNTGSKTTYRTGLQINHSFGNKLKAGLSVYYSNSVFEAPSDETENAFDITGSVSYALTRKLSFQMGYTFTRVESDNAFDGYTRNRVFLGARYAF